MSHSPQLFDADLRAARMKRARAQGVVDFLHREAAFEVKERLTEVTRTFTDGRIIGPFADIWQKFHPEFGNFAKGEANDILELEPGSHDLLIHALSLHHMNDPVGQLVQMRRALRPDGLCLAVMFGGQTLHELRAAMGAAEIALRGGLSPRVAPMADTRDLGGLLQRAGLALPVVDTVPLTVTYQSATHLMRELRLMGEGNVMTARDATPLTRGFLDHVNDIYATEYPAEDGRVAASFELMFLTGWAPAEGQQQPLRPGSAAARLADALGTVEHKTGDKTGR